MTQDQLARVRQFCSLLPETTERLSHGEPTFFVRNKVFVMFANNHHNDGHIAVWLPVPPGFQEGVLPLSVVDNSSGLQGTRDDRQENVPGT